MNQRRELLLTHQIKKENIMKREDSLTILSRMTDSTAQMVNRMATMIMMAPTALYLPMTVKAEIQPLESTSIIKSQLILETS